MAARDRATQSPGGEDHGGSEATGPATQGKRPGSDRAPQDPQTDGRRVMGGDQARDREGVGRTEARSDERCREILRDAIAERHRHDRELGAPGAARGTSAWGFGKGLSVVRYAKGRRGVPRSRASMTSAPPGSRFPPHGNTMRIE